MKGCIFEVCELASVAQVNLGLRRSLGRLLGKGQQRTRQLFRAARKKTRRNTTADALTGLALAGHFRLTHELD